MKKSTKGTVAASAAALLLLGGLGTHSAWSGADSIAGSDLNTGGISMTSPCDTDKDWTFGVGSVSTSLTDVTTVLHDNLQNLFLVPGDLLTKTCDFTVHIKGDHLANATLSVNNPTVHNSSGTLTALTVTPTFTDASGTAIADGATLKDGDVVTAQIDVSLDSGLLTGQDLTGTLDALTVTASQS